MAPWDTASLEAKRSITDEPADLIVRRIYETGNRDAINRIMMAPHDHDARAALPDDVQRGLEQLLDEDAVARDWYDARVQAAESLFLRHGVPILVAHVTASLPTCYTMKNGIHVLAHTDFLQLNATRRLYQTAQLIVDAMSPGGLAPGGKGVRTAQRVRLMHAAIRYLIRERATAPPAAPPDPPPPVPAGLWEEMLANRTWRPSWGEPVNQEDLAFTALTFSHVTLGALDALGLPVSAEQREGYLHAWSLVGHLLGIEDDLLVHDPDAARDLFARIEAHQAGFTPEGRFLANTIKFFLHRLLGIPLGMAQRVFYVLVRHLAGDAVADRLVWEEDTGKGIVGDLAMEVVEGALDLEAALEDHSRSFSTVARWVGKRLVAGLVAVPPGATRGMFEMPSHLTEWPPEAS